MPRMVQLSKGSLSKYLWFEGGGGRGEPSCMHNFCDIIFLIEDLLIVSTKPTRLNKISQTHTRTCTTKHTSITSVLHSTRFSASNILSTGMSECMLLVDSTSFWSRSFVLCLSSCNIGYVNHNSLNKADTKH